MGSADVAHFKQACLVEVDATKEWCPVYNALSGHFHECSPDFVVSFWKSVCLGCIFLVLLYKLTLLSYSRVMDVM